MKLTLLVITCFLLSQTSCKNTEDYLLSDLYIKETAQEKSNILWSRINENTSSAEWFWDIKTLKLINPFYDLNFTFNHKYDIFPESREKFIHSVGIISKVKINITNPLFTGMLKSGNNNCFLRFSTAKKFNPAKSSAKEAFSNFVPSMALKCLIDKKPSVNLMAMVDITGQESWNFFKNPLKSNFDAKTPSDMAVKLLINSFKKISDFPSAVGISDFTKFDEQGNIENEPVYPFYLEFAPVEENQKLFEDYYTKDWKDIIIKGVDEGKVIYNIIAHRIGCLPEKIGELVTASKFTTSFFSDRKLFFRHQRLSEDDKGKDTEKYRDGFEMLKGIIPGEPKREDKKCPFGY